MALPLAIGGGCGVLMGYAVLSTRIEIAPEGVLDRGAGLARLP